MAEQVTANQPPVETPTVMPAEEKKQYIIAKVKEFFDKENFKKNYSNLFDYIYDHQMNSIPLIYVLNELKVIEKVINEQTVTEALKSENLKESIVYLEKQQLILPTWRRLRNILYIKSDKGISNEIKTYLQENITIPEIVMTIDIMQEESVKITVTSPGKEEEHTKQIFSQLFQKIIKLADGKEFTFNCAIEEEHFPLPPNFSSNKQFKSHQFIPSQSQMIQQFNIQQYQQYLFQMQMAMQNYMYQNQKGHSKKGPRDQRGFQPQGAGAYSVRNGGVSAPVSNVATSGNDIQKSTHNGQQNHQGNNYQQNRAGQNNTGNKNNKPRRDGGKPFVKGPGGKSQKSFNATENDFPTLA